MKRYLLVFAAFFAFVLAFLGTNIVFAGGEEKLSEKEEVPAPMNGVVAPGHDLLVYLNESSVQNLADFPEKRA